MSEIGIFTVHGIPLVCKHCGNGEFAHRRAQLNAPFFSFFDLFWLPATADVYTCTRCGFLHWFISQASEEPLPGETAFESEPPESKPPSTAIQCLACGATIPADANTCPKCGWSYEDAARESAPE